MLLTFIMDFISIRLYVSLHRPLNLRGLISLLMMVWSKRGNINTAALVTIAQARWPNQQCQNTEGSRLAAEIGFSPTRTTPLCYNMN